MSDPVGILSLPAKIVLKRRLRGIDSIEVTVDERVNYATELVEGRQIYAPRLDFDAPLAFLIEHLEEHEDAEERLIIATGRTLDGLAMGNRLAWPDPANYPADTAGYDEQTAVPAETALKHYVDANAGPGAHADRQVPALAIATDAARGASGSWAARYQLVLDAALEIAYAADIGWQTTYDAQTGQHEVEVIIPTDRTTTVIFDFQFAALKDWARTVSLLDSKTLAVIGGQGELTARDIVIRPAVEPTGLERRETFIVSTDIALGETGLLAQRADAHLAAAQATRSLKATPREFGPFIYTRDWHLGDYVTVRNARRNLEYSAQIVEVWITVTESAGVPTIEAILDRPELTTRSRLEGSFSGGRADAGGTAAVPIDYAESADISTQAFGDTAAAGASVTEVAGANHKHGMPANPVTAHEGAADPHAGYRLESADHSHATTGLQGGTIAHSALTGVSADQHHAQSHSHASHTGIGANDHHAQAHTKADHSDYPLTTQHDLYVGGASGAPARLPKGGNFSQLEVDGAGAVAWATRRGFEGSCSAQAIANATDDPVEWTEVTDTDGFHSGSANAIVIPTGMGGWYAISASGDFSSGGTARHLLVKNGSTIIAYGPAGTTGTQRHVSWIGKLAAGDSITIVAFANAGSVTLTGQVGLVFLGA